MRTTFTVFALVAVLGLALGFQLVGQEKAGKSGTVQGTVQQLDKTKMAITVRAGTVDKVVNYTADTKFLEGHSKDNKPGSIDAVKETNYISCGGTFPAGKVQLSATSCVYRSAK